MSGVRQVGKWKPMHSASCCYGEMRVRFYHSSDLKLKKKKAENAAFYVKYSDFFNIWDESKYFKTLCELNKTWIASSDLLCLLKQSSPSTVKAWAGSWRFEFSDVTLENHLYLNQLTLEQCNPCALKGFPGPSCPQQDLICPFLSYP